MAYKSFFVALAGWMVVSIGTSRAQNNAIGQENNVRTITTAMPFLTISPDARAGALGDAGAATDPDLYSIYWNPAKVVFTDKDIGVGISVTPWLQNLGLNDIYLGYLPFYLKLREEDAITASMTYFSLGNIDFRTEDNQPAGSFSPYEVAVNVGYARQLGEGFSVGVGLRYMHSNLSGDATVTQGGATTNDTRPANGASVDLSTYYRTEFALGGTPSQLGLGANISNIGPKVSYSDTDEQDFIPTNMRLGFSYKIELDAFNTLALVGDANKLLVPTPPLRDEDGVIVEGRDPDETNLFSGIFGSFSDAPDGFSEEMKEFGLSGGVEYWYDNLLAARGGYFYEDPDKGGRQYFTVGVGIRYQSFGFDGAYLIPRSQNNPLANTFRVSLSFFFDKAANESVTE